MTPSKVIFITPMFNSEDYLPELVSSIVSQKNQNWEHVIVDDMSNDESYEKVLALTKKDSRFKVKLDIYGEQKQTISFIDKVVDVLEKIDNKKYKKAQQGGSLSKAQANLIEVVSL